MNVPLLRRCSVCGLGAYIKSDLEMFRKNQESIHGRENLCKLCYNQKQRDYGYRQKRWNDLVSGFDSPIICFHCDRIITDIEGKTGQSLAIHSLDGEHENWNPENKVPMHIECHSSFHNAGEKNPRYKGEKTNE